MIRSARELSALHDRAQLTGQFVLCRSEEFVPAGWPVRRLNGWMLAAHPNLAVADIVDGGGRCGWILGSAIDESGALVETNLRLPASGDATAFESALYRLGGRFLAIRLTPGTARVYLDPGGSLACVYAPGLDLLAATPSLIPYGFGCDDDDELKRASGVPFNSAVLGLGLTPRTGVQRLLPNHFLDLRNWSAHRHWPATPIRGDGDPEAATALVAGVVERHVRAFCTGESAYLPLTAGFDSRTILACARAHLDRCEFITLALPDRMGRIDVEIAQQIARACGLRHRVLRYREATDDELERWLWRTGFSVAEPRGWKATATYAQLEPDRRELVAVAGEAARASFWRELGRGAKITPAVVLDALQLPAMPRFLEAAEVWLRDLPVDRPMNIVDLFLFEQRIGCWASILCYGDADAVRFRLFPMIHRDAIAAMLSLSDAYKLSQRFPRDIIRLRWPELERFPFNREPGLRHFIHRARRRVWLLRRALSRT